MDQQRKGRTDGGRDNPGDHDAADGRGDRTCPCGRPLQRFRMFLGFVWRCPVCNPPRDARVTASAEDDAAGLAREWAGRTGCLVVVFTASGPLTAGQPVWPCCDTEVRAASGDGRSYGRALHSAAHGALVAVEPATGTGE